MKLACWGLHCFADDFMSVEAFPANFSLNSFLPGMPAETQAGSVLQQ
jgi:hypothetical protein